MDIRKVRAKAEADGPYKVEFQLLRALARARRYLANLELSVYELLEAGHLEAGRLSGDLAGARLGLAQVVYRIGKMQCAVEPYNDFSDWYRDFQATLEVYYKDDAGHMEPAPWRKQAAPPCWKGSKDDEIPGIEGR